MMIQKHAVFSLVVLMLSQACVRQGPPSPDELRRRLLADGTAVFLADTTLHIFPTYGSHSESGAWRVTGPKIDSASDATFERTILRAMHGRASTLLDSVAQKFSVDKVTVQGDSGFMENDRGSLDCSGGNLSGGGTAATYVFHLERGRWKYLRNQNGVSYDPAVPMPELADRAACARAIAR